MLFCVFTIGLTYLDSSRLQNTRLNGAEYDITTMNGFTSKQVKSLQSNKNIQNVGMESYAGFIKSSEFDNTVEIGLLKMLSRQYQQTLIVITHDTDIAQMADRIVQIEDGKISKGSGFHVSE